jgi:hypothetical protein
MVFLGIVLASCILNCLLQGSQPINSEVICWERKRAIGAQAFRVTHYSVSRFICGRDARAPNNDRLGLLLNLVD